MEFIYKGLEASYQPYVVTDEEVDRQMERLRQQTPKIRVITDRAAQLGDEVVLDYAGFCDGEQFAGGTAEKQTLVLGSGAFIPGFEQQLVGSRPGESVTVQVTFPEQYHAAALAGKPAEFRCLVHESREKSAYALDDEFARAMGLEDLEGLRKSLRESLQQYSDERGELDLQDQLIRKAAETLDFQATQEEIDRAVEEQMETLRAQLARQKLSMEMYCEFSGKSEQQLREDVRPEAEQDLRIRAAIGKIVELEQIEATQEEIADSLAAICRQNRITMEQLQAVYDAEFEQAVIRNVRMRKAMRLVRDNAVVTTAE